jgi:hypothetical protein
MFEGLHGFYSSKLLTNVFSTYVPFFFFFFLSRLMRSTCCLSMNPPYQYLNAWNNLHEIWYVHHDKWANLKVILNKSLPPVQVSVCLSLLLLLGKVSRKSTHPFAARPLLGKDVLAATKTFGRRRFLCGAFRIQVIQAINFFFRTSCYNYVRFIIILIIDIISRNRVPTSRLTDCHVPLAETHWSTPHCRIFSTTISRKVRTIWAPTLSKWQLYPLLDNALFSRRTYRITWKSLLSSLLSRKSRLDIITMAICVPLSQRWNKQTVIWYENFPSGDQPSLVHFKFL